MLLEAALCIAADLQLGLLLQVTDQTSSPQVTFTGSDPSEPWKKHYEELNQRPKPSLSGMCLQAQGLVSLFCAMYSNMLVLVC